MIAITGDANREHAWKNMTQEARQLEILRPAVKEVIRVEVIKRVPEHVRRAFAVATSGPARARCCSTCRRTSRTASTISTPRISGSTRRR